MKIVHICLAGLYMSGWGYQDNLIAKYQKLEGHDVTVIANRYVYDEKGNYTPTDKIVEIDVNGVKIVRLAQKGDKQQKGPAERVHYIGLYETLENEKPDTIFIHNPQIMDVDDIVRYMKSHKETRLYVDSHSDYSNSGRNFLSKHILHGVFWRNRVQKLVPYTRKFYGVLPARVDFLLDRYKTPKDKTELLVMGMDDEKAEAADRPEIIKEIRAKYNISDDDFLIVTGGKIDSAKRQTLLLMDAVKTINLSQNISRKIKLLIFGSVADELKPEFDKILESSEDIDYIGWLDADDTYPYFAAADLVVFPGRHSVMWEQVAGQGKPMIVKYWEGTTHVDLGGNCKFIMHDTVEDIVRSIIDAAEPDEYEKMTSVAQDKGPKIFSYRSISRKCIEENNN